MSDCNCNKDQTTADISANAMPCDTTSDKSPVCSCCSMKHTDRSEADRRKLVNRLKRIEGQIRGIIGMLENDAYCNDILIQSAAVNAAVNSFNKELLANHIRTCVARDIREGKDDTIDEQDVTPGTLDTAFSTRELQAAQLIPVTLYCSIVLPPYFISFCRVATSSSMVSSLPSRISRATQVRI